MYETMIAKALNIRKRETVIHEGWGTKIVICAVTVVCCLKRVSRLRKQMEPSGLSELKLRVWETPAARDEEQRTRKERASYMETEFQRAAGLSSGSQLSTGDHAWEEPKSRGRITERLAVTTGRGGWGRKSASSYSRLIHRIWGRGHRTIFSARE